MFFMPDELNPVNDLVKAHIAKSQENNGGENPEKKVDEKKPEGVNQNEPPAPNPLDEFLKEFNLESVEQLKEKLKPPPKQKELSPEEKEKEAKVYQANLLSFAAEKGIMNPEDYVKFENVKAKADHDLVYEGFASELKEDEPDLTEEEIKEKFENRYPVNSDNPKIKARAEARLKKEAAEYRKPLESSFNKAKTEFDEDRDFRNTFPDYDKTIRGFITENIPAKYEAYKAKDGDEEIAVEVDLSEDEKKEITENVAKRIQTTDTFSQYKKGEIEALKKLTQQVTAAFVREKKREEANAKIAATYLKRGFDKGSVGAKAPFPLVGGIGNTGAGGGTSNAKERVLEDMKKKK